MDLRYKQATGWRNFIEKSFCEFFDGTQRNILKSYQFQLISSQTRQNNFRKYYPYFLKYMERMKNVRALTLNQWLKN